MSQSERDQLGLRRRLEVLALPVLPLRRRGFVGLPADQILRERRVADSPVVGVGPEGDLVGFFTARGGGVWGAVTRTTTGARGDTSTVEVQDAPEDVRFVQPLPDGGSLLSGVGERDADAIACRIYDADGNAVASGRLGDAAQHVLATPSGQIWVGYFDEILGVARFDSNLKQRWGAVAGMPNHFNCYALNVDQEAATTYAYTAFHLTRIEGDQWTDLGQSPQRGANALLVQGDRAVLVGGYGAEYDLLTPVRITADAVAPAGQLRRLVLPDGLEVSGRRRFFCRGPDLHVVLNSAWYQLNLDEVFS